MEGAQIEVTILDLAYELFGEEAFLGTYVLYPEVHLFMKTVIATTYNRWQKEVHTFKRALERKRQKMDSLEESEYTHSCL